MRIIMLLFQQNYFLGRKHYEPQLFWELLMLCHFNHNSMFGRR